MQLVELRMIQGMPEMRLTDQHELQRAVTVGLRVSEHAQLFQGRWRQVLRLIDDQHHGPAGGVLVA